MKRTHREELLAIYLKGLETYGERENYCVGIIKATLQFYDLTYKEKCSQIEEIIRVLDETKEAGAAE